jgi:hypothetical protein
MRYWPDPPTQVLDADWVSQFDAADSLGISLLQVGLLLANGHLDPAEDPEGIAGVTKISLELEKDWRESASFRDKVMRAVASAARRF